MIVGVLALQGAFLEHVTMLNKVRTQRGLRFETITVRNAEELSRCSALLIPGGESTVILSQACCSPGLLPALQSFISNEDRPVYGSCAGMILMADVDGVAGGRRGVKQEGLGGIKGMRVWRNLYGNQLASFEAPLAIPVLSDPTRPFPGIFIRAPAIHSFSPNNHDVDGLSPQVDGGRLDEQKGEEVAPASPTTPKASFQSRALPAQPEPSVNTKSDTTKTISSQPTHPLCLLPASLSATAPADTERFGPADEQALRIVMARQGKHLVTSFHPELSQDERIHEYFLVELCGLKA